MFPNKNLIFICSLGVSLEALPGVTPEIYPSTHHPEKFIIPGIKSDTELQKVLHELDKVADM